MVSELIRRKVLAEIDEETLAPGLPELRGGQE